MPILESTFNSKLWFNRVSEASMPWNMIAMILVVLFLLAALVEVLTNG